MRTSSVLAFVLALVSLPAEVVACSCENVSLEERCASSPLAFSAEVVRVVPRNGRFTMTLRTLAVFRGEIAGEVEMFMGIDDASAPPDAVENSCELARPFEPGQYVQFFLDDVDQRHILVCTHARPVSRADAMRNPCLSLTRVEAELDDMEVDEGGRTGCNAEPANAAAAVWFLLVILVMRVSSRS